MKISTQLTATSLFLIPTLGFAADCGLWYTSPCVCDTDIRYCREGQNGASNDILDQHPIWAHMQGFYKFEAYTFTMGLYLGLNTQVQDNPFYGYLNHTIIGSRDYQHRYDVYPPADASDPTKCAPPRGPGPPYQPFFTCGVNGIATIFEGFATSTYERDGSLTTTSALSAGAVGDSREISEGTYKMVPVDENSLQGSVDSDLFLVTETFVFTNKERTAAGSSQDVYMKAGDESVLVQTTKLKFTKLPDEQTFIDGVNALTVEHNVVPMLRAAVVPMNSTCWGPECPTEEYFCEVDPTCSVSPYQEPDATIKAGPIVGIVSALFVVILCALYYWHQRSMATQRERLKNMFAKHVIDSLEIGKGASSADYLTMDALQKEFNAIDVGEEGGDGKISKAELHAFMTSGKLGDISDKDFNTLFGIIDADGSGEVDFIEFSSFMGDIKKNIDDKKNTDEFAEA